MCKNVNKKGLFYFEFIENLLDLIEKKNDFQMERERKKRTFIFQRSHEKQRTCTKITFFITFH